VFERFERSVGLPSNSSHEE